MNTELLNVEKVAEYLQVSIPTIYYYLQQRRRGLSDFPLPIGNRKQRLLWIADEIERYVLNRNAANNPDSAPVSKRKHSPKTIETLKQFGIAVPQ